MNEDMDKYAKFSLAFIFGLVIIMMIVVGSTR